MRSFASSSSTTTALWAHQELADNGSNSISSVLKLRRVDPPPDASKTPEARRERKNSASSSVEVEGLGNPLIDNYNKAADDILNSSGFPVPKVVLCQDGLSSRSSYHYVLPTAAPQSTADQTIGEAAGLLLSLSHAM